MLEIIVPKESKGLYIGAKTGHSSNEYEFLLPRDTKFKVLSRNSDTLRLEVIP